MRTSPVSSVLRRVSRFLARVLLGILDKIREYNSMTDSSYGMPLFLERWFDRMRKYGKNQDEREGKLK